MYRYETLINQELNNDDDDEMLIKQKHQNVFKKTNFDNNNKNELQQQQHQQYNDANRTYLQEILVQKHQLQHLHYNHNHQDNNNDNNNVNKNLSSAAIKLLNQCNYLNIIEYYRNKTVLITGATGFIGKVLLEKLLRLNVCRRIYVLLRKKQNKTSYERLNDLLTKSKCFKFHDGYNFNTIQSIDGDIVKNDLGLSLNDYRLLINDVDIVIHSAASVQFKGNLRIFIEQNVFGTDNIMNLCTKMLNLKSVVYVSTAYANCNLSMIEEKIYPINYTTPYAYVNEDNIEEFIDDVMLKYGDMWPKSGHPALWSRPNCYTFSKALAELLIVKKYGNRLPYVICRPSIVTHAVSEPAPGWCDTKNGVSGAMILGGLGIARTMIINEKCNADIIPVDYVVNSLIVIAAYTAMVPSEKRKQVIHLTSGERNPITWGQLLDRSRDCVMKNPFLKQIRPIARKPEIINTFYGRLNHQLTKIFSHYCFAIIADGIVLLTGNKPFLWNITKRMHLGFDTLEPFTNNEWRFEQNNYQEIYQQLSPREQDIFASNVDEIDWMKYTDNATLGTRRFLLNEDDSTIDQAIKRQKFLNWAYGTVEAIIYLLIYAFIWWHIFAPHFDAQV